MHLGNGRMEEGTIFNGAEIKPDRVVVRAERNGAVVEYYAKLIVGANGQDYKVRQALYLPTRVGECQSHYQFMTTRAINTLYKETGHYLARGKMGRVPLHAWRN